MISTAEPPTAEVEVLLGDGQWRATYVMARDEHGRKEVHSVRVEPVGTRPPGGLTAQVIHALRIGDVLRRWQIAGDLRLVLELAGHTTFRSARRRRQRITGELMRAVVASYVRAVLEGDPHPAKTVARQLRLNRNTARWLINRARHKGLLPPTRQGIAAGGFTPEGRALLAAPLPAPPPTSDPKGAPAWPLAPSTPRRRRRTAKRPARRTARKASRAKARRA